MSNTIKDLVTCCYCEHEQTVEKSYCLNTIVDKDAYNRTINHQEMLVTCEKCGEVAFLDHPLLYHDPEKHFMVQYSSYKDDLKDFILNNQKMQDTYKDLTYHYTMRICDYYIDFIEKVMILNKGYNDIAMELYKFHIYTTLENKSVSEIHYNITNDNEEIIVKYKNKQKENFAFRKEIYEVFLDSVKESKIMERHDVYFVDAQYALNVINNKPTPLHYQMFGMEENTQKEDKK